MRLTSSAPSSGRSFFEGVAQRELPIRQYRGKAPMFFRDARVAGAFFPIDIARVGALLPDARLQAVAAGPRLGVLAIVALSYGDSDLGPYNEVFVAAGVHAGRSWLPQPLRTARSLLTRSLSAYIVQLPVDSEAALYGGIDYYNVPKFMAAIEMTDKDGSRVCTVRDPIDGALLFALRCRKPARYRAVTLPQNYRQTLRSYSVHKERPIVAEFRLRTADAASLVLGGAELTIGMRPQSQLLRSLRPGRALATFTADHADAILGEPSFW